MSSGVKQSLQNWKNNDYNFHTQFPQPITPDFPETTWTLQNYSATCGFVMIDSRNLLPPTV